MNTPATNDTMTTAAPTKATEPLHITATHSEDGWEAIVNSGRFNGTKGHGETMEEAVDNILFYLYDTHGLVWSKAERVTTKLV